MTLQVIILAAGQGKRMQSTLPKVLHQIGGIAMIERVIHTALQLSPDQIYVIYGHEGEQIQTHCKPYPVQWIKQEKQLGTGHAVQQMLPFLQTSHSQILILYADVPLITGATLKQFIHKTDTTSLGVLTAIIDNPSGFGRIVRNNDNHIQAIIEDKDATTAQREIKEINTGIMLVTANHLLQWLPQLDVKNAQGEYYLTDIVAIAATHNIPVIGMIAPSADEVTGVNDRYQLAQLERYYQTQLAKQYMLSGVTLLDPCRFDVRGTTHIEPDVTIDINVILEGQNSIGAHSHIGPNVILRNVTVGHNVEIKANCHIEDAVIGDNCKIGPFARIRPGTKLDVNVSIGNFVEIKNADIGAYSKIPHLSYVGDAKFGHHVNFGAGAITCNYDGVKKHQTIIGNHVFIGSDSQIIAPVTIADEAFIGAGSTITKDAPPAKLTLSRVKQQTVEHWQRPRKEE